MFIRNTKSPGPPRNFILHPLSCSTLEFLGWRPPQIWNLPRGQNCGKVSRPSLLLAFSVLLQKVQDSFFKQVVLPLVELRCQNSKLLYKVNSQGGVVAFPFFSHSCFLPDSKPHSNINSLTNLGYLYSYIVSDISS